MTDSLGEIMSAETAIGRPTATARHLVEASISANTRRSYASVLRRLDAWLDGRLLKDASLGDLTPGRVQEAHGDDPRVVRREPNGRHSPVISGPKKPGRSVMHWRRSSQRPTTTMLRYAIATRLHAKGVWDRAARAPAPGDRGHPKPT